MRILITGGAGFIGSHTAERLSHDRHQVVVLDNFSTGRSENLRGYKGKIQIADICDIELLERNFADFLPDAVLHLAAQAAITTSEQNPALDAEINAIGTLNVIEMCKKYKTGKIVFSSTSAVYSSKDFFVFGVSEGFPKEPESPYGISKLAAEQYVRTMFPDHVVFRYGNVYGPKQHPIGENQVVARAMAHFINGDDFKVFGDGNQKRDFVYVEDVARANIMALTSHNLRGTYNLCTGKSHSVLDVLKEIEKSFEISGYLWEHTKKQDSRGSVYLSSAKVKRDFGISFTSLSSGIEKTSAWWREK